MNRLFSLDRNTNGLYLLALLSLAIAATLASTVQLNGVDFWLQAKVGELIAQHHAIPKTLLFPFTEVAQDPFQAHEWLASLLFHYALRGLGEDYMPLLIGMHGTVLFLLAARLGYLRSGANPALALVAGFVTVLLENYRHVMRPELPAILVMLACWLCLESFHQRPRWTPAILAPLLMVAWTNMHGSFVLGVALTGIYTVNSAAALLGPWSQGKSAKRTLALWIALSAAMVLATLANPQGLDLWRFVLSFGTNNANKVLTEWYPTLDPRLASWQAVWVVLAGWGVTIALCIWRWRQLTRIDILLVLVFSVLFFRAIRFPVYFALVAGYVFAGLLPRPSMRARRAMLLGLIGIASLSSVYVLKIGNVSRSDILGAFDHYRFSPLLVQKLADPTMQGNVFNEMEQGAELIYRAYPRLKPMVDCRFDSYSGDYLAFLEALKHDDKLFDEFVARYDVRYLMMNMDGYETFLNQPRSRSGRWQHYFNDRYIIILRRVDV